MALDFGKLNFSVSFNPTSAFPLDARSYFESYAEAEAAAAQAVAAGSAESVYYHGQTLVVVEGGKASFYIIQPNNTLSAVAGEGGSSSITVNTDLFEYDESGNLSLKGFNEAEVGAFFTKGEGGTLIWNKPIDAYTKTETDEKIAAAVAAADHLSRKVVKSLDEAKEYMNNNDDADRYIFMVPTGLSAEDDKYDEYVVIVIEDEEGIETKILEKVGSWEVDLSGYAKTVDVNAALDKKVDAVENARLMTDEEAAKLASLSACIIDSVDPVTFTIVEKKLTLNPLPLSQVANLETLLNNKVEKQEGYTLLSPSDQAKLDALVIGDDNKVEISGKVNASNVLELDTWITENAANHIVNLTDANLSTDLVDKINFITSVDPNHFTVADGQLKFTPVEGRLINTKEASALGKLMAGGYDNYIKSVNTDIFTVTNGQLNLTNLPTSLLSSTVGDLTSLTTYQEGTTVVNELNNIYEMLTWQDLR